MKVLFLLSISVSLAHAIVNGTKIESREDKEEFSFLFNISFNMHESSASYLGNGFFITALHNTISYGPIYDTNQKLPLIILDINNNPIAWDDKSYKLIRPPVSHYLSQIDAFGRKVKIPQPDIVVIKVNNEIKDKLKGYKTVKVARPNFNISDGGSILLVAGVGGIKHNSFDGGGFNYGRVLITGQKDDLIYSSWFPEIDGLSAPTFGDSGGPLIGADHAENVVQIGVIRTEYVKRNQDRAIIGVQNSYTDLRNIEINKWLMQVLNFSWD